MSEAVVQDDADICIPVTINNDLERRIADTFAVFDHQGNNTVDTRELGTVIRALGCVPSDAEIQEIILDIQDTKRPGIIHLASFMPYMCQVVNEHKYQPASAEQLLEAFQLLDSDNRGYLEKDYFGDLMTQDGEPLNQDELDEMLELAVDPSTQTIPYEYYINRLMDYGILNQLFN